MSRTKRLLSLALLAGVALLTAAVAVGLGNGSGKDPAGDSPLRTVEVTRMTLVDSVDVDAVIGFGDIVALHYLAPPTAAGSGAAQAGSATSAGGATADTRAGRSATSQASDDNGLGLVTWLPAVGTIVRLGEPLLRVDERPVVLLYGAIPLYRTLKPGLEGADVQQLESSLHALGYSGFTVDRNFTDATASVVRRWQKSVGLPQTGTISPGQVLYNGGAVRIAEQRIHIGEIASGDILGYTGAVPSVSATVDISSIRGEIKPGMSVSVVVDGDQGAGTVDRVAPATAADAQAQDQSGPSLRVDVSVADPKLLGNRQGSVTVRFVRGERKDVLVVPVVALVALAEGGYGVQVVDGTSLRYEPVGTGLFARGMVEITSGDVSVGMKVVVP